MRQFIAATTLLLLPLTPIVIPAQVELPDRREFKVALVCAHGVDCDRAQKIFDEASVIMEDALPVDIVTTTVYTIALDMPGTPEEMMQGWIGETKDLNEDYDMVYVMITPYPESLEYIDFESQNVLGMANVLGCFGKEARCIAWGRIVGGNKMSARIAAHEMAHLFGASHDLNFAGFMAPAANVFQYAESFSLDSIKQMEFYLQLVSP